MPEHQHGSQYVPPNGNGRWTSWQIINVVLTVMVVPLTGVIVLMGAWAFNGIVNLQINLGKAEAKIEVQKEAIAALTSSLASIPDKVVPADFKQEFVGFKTEISKKIDDMGKDTSAKLDNLSGNVSVLTGIMKEHTRAEVLMKSPSASKSYTTEP